MVAGLQDLNQFDRQSFDRGRSFAVELLWRVLSALFFESSWLPWYGPKRWLLRLFGAHVGEGVIIKPKVKITFPWRLHIGDAVWLGEAAWLDNLDLIKLEDHVVISQGAYLCTGNHHYGKVSFDLMLAPIHIQAHAWIGAHACVGPGVIVGRGSVLTLGSVAHNSLPANGIFTGVPAVWVRERELNGHIHRNMND